MNKILRAIPKVDKILASKDFEDLLAKYKQPVLVKIIQTELKKLREKIIAGKHKDICNDKIIKQIKYKVKQIFSDGIRYCVNGTGVVLNTGLGRAPFSNRASEKVEAILSGYSTLEVNVKTGKRGRREDKIDELVSYITGAEAATVVNNNAAAVMICLNTLAENKDVIISRGEQVEIGGAFRMPDVIEKSGCNMIEVGATNKTRKDDYAKAVGTNCGALVKVHTSNYRVMGFMEEVNIEEFARLGKDLHIPTYYDLGGGIVDSLENYGLPYEPLVQDSLAAGIDLVSFSGDKVLGGPQCGIIAGTRESIEKIKANPLMRVFRIDKVRIALLEETLKIFLENNATYKDHKTLQMLSYKREYLRKTAFKLKEYLENDVPKSWNLEVKDIVDQAGSGTLPTETIDGIALVIEQPDISVSKFSMLMREICKTPVFGYIKNDAYYLSMRTIFESDFEIIRSILKAIIATL